MKANCYACVAYDDMRKLDTGSHVVVGTPGCVYDMIAKQFLNTQFIEIFVLCETDKIWSRDFKDQIKKVFKFLKENIQVILTSSTISEDVLDVSTRFMCNPVHIMVQKELTLKGL